MAVILPLAATVQPLTYKPNFPPVNPPELTRPKQKANQMKTIANYDELNVPEYALSYLVNGDVSGIDKTDLEICRSWFKWYESKAAEVPGAVAQFNVVSSPEGNFDPYFCKSPEFGLPCNCVECEVLIFAPETTLPVA